MRNKLTAIIAVSVLGASAAAGAALGLQGVTAPEPRSLRPSIVVGDPAGGPADAAQEPAQEPVQEDAQATSAEDLAAGDAYYAEPGASWAAALDQVIADRAAAERAAADAAAAEAARRASAPKASTPKKVVPKPVHRDDDDDEVDDDD